MDISAYMPGDSAVAAISDDLIAYNRERLGAYGKVRWRRPVFLTLFFVVVLFALFVAFGIVANGGSGIPFGIVVVAGSIGFFYVNDWTKSPATRLQQSFRDHLIPRVFGFIDGVTYRYKAVPPSFAGMPAAAFERFNRYAFEDMISGTRNGLAFEVFEATLTYKVGKNTSMSFKGLVLAFGIDKPFPGAVVAAKVVGSVHRFMRDLFGKGGMQQVKSGDAALDETYEFRSDNEAAAAALISSGLARALDDLQSAWPEQPARIAISGGYGYVILPTARNFFELPAIAVDCDYGQHIRPMISDLGTLLAIAEEVKAAVDR